MCVQGKCQPRECGLAMTFFNGSCEACPVNCEYCLTPRTCQRCRTGLYLRKDQNCTACVYGTYNVTIRDCSCPADNIF
jgi:hypothetical protein